MKKLFAGIVCGGVALAGCSTASKDIAASYVSPMQYNTYDCDQIAAENARLAGKVSQLGGRLDEAAANDKAITGVGMVLFWPALFALGGTKQQEAEYAKLRGEHDALQQTAVMKKCDMASTTLQAKKAPETVEVKPVETPAMPLTTSPAPSEVAQSAEPAKQ